MVTQVANPMAARVRREAVSDGIPIPPVKITAPGVPDSVVPCGRGSPS